VNLVKNVNFWAIKLAGERRERGNYASLVKPIELGVSVAKLKRAWD